MKFSCPNPDCSGVIGLSDRSCGECGFVLTLGNVFRHYFSAFRRKGLKLRCPHCEHANPLKSPKCESCGHPLTVSSVVDPPRAKWRSLIGNASPEFKKRVQLAHMILSAILLLWLIGYIESTLSIQWIFSVFLSVLYLAVFVVCSMWVVPKPVRYALIRRPAPITRIGLIFNFFSGVFLLQMMITNWVTQSLVLAAVFIVIWVATWIFVRWFWPLISEASSIIVSDELPQSPSQEFRADGSQGRRTFFD